MSLAESEQNCSWEFKSHREKRQADKDNLLFSLKREELIPDLMPGCILHLHLFG